MSIAARILASALHGIADSGLIAAALGSRIRRHIHNTLH